MCMSTPLSKLGNNHFLNWGGGGGGWDFRCARKFFIRTFLSQNIFFSWEGKQNIVFLTCGTKIYFSIKTIHWLLKYIGAKLFSSRWQQKTFFSYNANFFFRSVRALKNYFFNSTGLPYKMVRYVFFWATEPRPLYILILMPMLDPISDCCLTKSSLSPNFLRIIQAKTYTPFQTVVTKSMPHARHKIKNRIPIVRTSPWIRSYPPRNSHFHFVIRHSIAEISLIWCLAVNNRWINHFFIARWRTIFF